MNPLTLIYSWKNPNNPHRQTTSPLGSLYSEGVFHCFPPLNLQKKKQRFLSTPSKLRTKTGMMISTNKQMKPESFHIRIGSFLYHFFFFFKKHFSYIYWFSSSSFREHSQMCKATSNSNISWSKKWNLHLTAFFNNVQSPFNRKMEQSANRKRKGLIKTHQSWSWRFPLPQKHGKHILRSTPSWQVALSPLLTPGTCWARRNKTLRCPSASPPINTGRTEAEAPREGIFCW